MTRNAYVIVQGSKVNCLDNLGHGHVLQVYMTEESADYDLKSNMKLAGCRIVPCKVTIEDGYLKGDR